MQKALKLMNLQLRAGLTDITGVTGQAILRAIVHGERDPLRLAQWRTAACTSSADVMAKALTGTWRDEQVFMLTQALEFFDFYTRRIAACDAQIERQFAAMKPRFTSDEPSMPLPRVKPGSQSKHQPSYNARTYLMRLTGVDLVAVTGIAASIAQTILTEVGLGDDLYTVQHKMLCPSVGTRIEKPDEGPRTPHDRPNIAALRAIAEGARIGQVLCDR